MFGPFSRYAAPYRGRMLAGVLAIAFAQAAAAIIPRELGLAIDALGVPTDESDVVVGRHIRNVQTLALVVALGG